MEPAMTRQGEIRIFRTIGAAVAAIISLAGANVTLAQSMPDTENGRYALSQVFDGVLRLDTRTGATSICNDRGGGWACHAMPDERMAYDEEIGRLQKENETLKAQLAARAPPAPGKIDEPLPKGDSLKPPEPKVADGGRKIEIPRIEIPLPSDRDVDRMMSAVEQAWRRLVEMANRMQKDFSGRI
jgi:hypothetical protein